MEIYRRFMNLTFDDFRTLSKDDSLSRFEKIGFPDSYRDGKETLIHDDICRKLTNLSRPQQVVADIGPGCSDLPLMLIDLCARMGHTLLLFDSQEMLDNLPDEDFIVKIPGRFPEECRWVFDRYAGKLDAVLTYSVFHYIFDEGDIFGFLDRSLSLLADGGELLIGDIPNVSKRKRFFSAPSGVEFHQAYTGTADVPKVDFNTPEPGRVDDAILMSLIARSRSAGFDAYWYPQPPELPMANRREDLYIRKP